MQDLKERLFSYFRGLDKQLLLLSWTASAYGLALLYSAVHSYGTDNYLRTQIIAVCLGTVLYLVLSALDLRPILRRYLWLIPLELLLLFTLRLWGVGEGNHGWIRFGGIGVQPAELGKPLFILSFSGHLAHVRGREHHLTGALGLLLHAGAVCAFVMVFSRDDGMTLVYLFLALFLALCAGMRPGILAAFAVLGMGLLPLLWTFLLDPYQQTRILAVLEPERYPATAWQAMQTTHAIASGGLSGRGFLQGPYTQYGLIPTKHTDSIIAVAGEELGFLGCGAVLLLLGLLILRCTAAALRAEDPASALTAGGIAGMLAFQTVLNLGMNLGLLPVVGLTLPFFSYGGSSIVTMYAAMGMAAGIRRRQRRNKEIQDRDGGFS